LFYFEKFPRISKEYIMKLFLGDSHMKLGILHYIGKTQDERIAAVSCLSFVLKLLDYQKNPNAEMFNKVFASSTLILVRAMNLDIHLD
jgi:hypothetical protein